MGRGGGGGKGSLRDTGEVKVGTAIPEVRERGLVSTSFPGSLLPAPRKRRDPGNEVAKVSEKK